MSDLEETSSSQSADAVREYKTILREILDARPAGTRLRLAMALGKNRSFVSQIANPQYATPIPIRHLDTIFELCHFPQAVRRRFLDAYAKAHPTRHMNDRSGHKMRRQVLALPDLGDAQRNARFDALIMDFARKMSRVLAGSD
ncbi:MAG TPA: hypothetical protein VHK03_13995 [Aestuariivirgaceae bacterium]|nr:hypothetical protein [Aestuariivirgaceae bacterium]